MLCRKSLSKKLVLDVCSVTARWSWNWKHQWNIVGIEYDSEIVVSSLNKIRKTIEFSWFSNVFVKVVWSTFRLDHRRRLVRLVVGHHSKAKTFNVVLFMGVHFIFDFWMRFSLLRIRPTRMNSCFVCVCESSLGLLLLVFNFVSYSIIDFEINFLQKKFRF